MISVWEHIECQNCGGLLKFSIIKQKFACDSCGAEKDIGETDSQVTKNDFDSYQEREKNSVAFTGMASVSCQRCGVEISFDESQAEKANREDNISNEKGYQNRGNSIGCTGCVDCGRDVAEWRR